MSDRFYTPVEFPELPTKPANPDAGFVRAYSRNGKFYILNSAGVEIPLDLPTTVDAFNIDGGSPTSPIYTGTGFLKVDFGGIS